MYENKLAAAWNVYLGLGLVTISNEPLELGMRNVIWRYIMHMPTGSILNSALFMRKK
jgi:hypothetical protein